MAERRLGIIMHGVTGRMGYNQHLVRSILAIRDQGGIALRNGDRLMVDPIIVGRDEDKIRRLAEKHNIARWTTDLDGALKNAEDTVFFDAGNAYGFGKDFDPTDLRLGAGVGVRFFSPLGPLRLDLGYNLDKEPGEKDFQVHFTVGSPF